MNSYKEKSFKEFSDDYTSFKQPQISPLILTDKVVLYDLLIDITDSQNTNTYDAKHTLNFL